MPSLRQLKAFAHNIADSYLSTLSWFEHDYTSTWLYRAALESKVNRIELDILNKRITPPGVKHHSVLLESIAGLDLQFFEMIQSQQIAREEIASLVFYCAFPALSKKTILVICTPVATDRSGKEHRGAPVRSEYDYQLLP